MGCLLGVVFSLWIAFGSYSIDKQYGTLPVNTDNCMVSENNIYLSNITDSPQPVYTPSVNVKMEQPTDDNDIK